MIYHIFVDLLSMCCLHFQNLKFWRTRKRKTQKLVKYISYTSNLSITVKVIVILTYSHSLLFNTLSIRFSKVVSKNISRHCIRIYIFLP